MHLHGHTHTSQTTVTALTIVSCVVVTSSIFHLDSRVKEAMVECWATKFFDHKKCVRLHGNYGDLMITMVIL